MIWVGGYGSFSASQTWQAQAPTSASILLDPHRQAAARSDLAGVDGTEASDALVLPKPWQTVDCEIDLRPGGIFRTVMRGPENQMMDNPGCYLEVVKPQRLTFTSVLGPGFRPVADPFLPFTAILSFEDLGGGSTRYHVRALHRSDADRQKHAEMGFDQGWAKALEQLVEYAPAIKS